MKKCTLISGLVFCQIAFSAIQPDRFHIFGFVQGPGPGLPGFSPSVYIHPQLDQYGFNTHFSLTADSKNETFNATAFKYDQGPQFQQIIMIQNLLVE